MRLSSPLLKSELVILPISRKNTGSLIPWLLDLRLVVDRRKFTSHFSRPINSGTNKSNVFTVLSLPLVWMTMVGLRFKCSEMNMLVSLPKVNLITLLSLTRLTREPTPLLLIKLLRRVVLNLVPLLCSSLGVDRVNLCIKKVPRPLTLPVTIIIITRPWRCHMVILVIVIESVRIRRES